MMNIKSLSLSFSIMNGIGIVFTLISFIWTENWEYLKWSLTHMILAIMFIGIYNSIEEKEK